MARAFNVAVCDGSTSRASARTTRRERARRGARLVLGTLKIAVLGLLFVPLLSAIEPALAQEISGASASSGKLTCGEDLMFCTSGPGPVNCAAPEMGSGGPPCGTCGPAETLTYRCCRVLQRTPWSNAFSVDRFPAGLGTLTRVDIRACFLVDANVCITNTSRVSCDFNVMVAVPFARMDLGDANGPAPGALASVIDTPITRDGATTLAPTESWEMPNGERRYCTDCANPGSQTPPGIPCEMEAYPTPILDQPSLDWFIQGVGGNSPISFDMINAQATVSITSGCSTFDQEATILLGATLEVVYTYCPNEPPVCMDDEAVTCEGESVDIFVLANDYDPDGQLDCSSIEILTPPSNGSWSLVNCPAVGCSTLPPNGCAVRYTPNAGYAGCDSFTYRVADDEGCYSSPCGVEICVYPDPVANDDVGELCEGQGSLVIDVLGNDSVGSPIGACCATPSIDPGSLEICAQPPNGTASVVGGMIRYEPDPGYCGGVDTFSYRFRTNQPANLPQGQHCQSECADVNVTVYCGPTAVDDCVFAGDDTPTPVDIFFLLNDIPPTGGMIDCSSITFTQPPNGSVAIVDCAGAGCNPNVCRFEYTPDGSIETEDCFEYTIRAANAPPGEQCMSTAMVCIKPNCPTYDRRKPSALLVYPEFDNREGAVTTLTVTNTHKTQKVNAHFEYVDGETCSEFDRGICLTPNDTFTFLTKYHNPDNNQGYVYVYAECCVSEDPIAFNYLIGSQLVVDGFDIISYSVNPWAFCAPEGPPPNDPDCPLFRLTDVDNDGIRDLDGNEYECAPDQILIPRFFGQDGPDGIESCMVLIALSGGKAFTTTLDFTFYNDNEEPISAEETFYCWWKGPLTDISQATRNSFLRTGTIHDPDEILGNETQESGWIRIDGDIAESPTTVIQDPAFLALLIECVDTDRCVADLPFELCGQTNGDLLPIGNEGDPNPDE